jgi:hypothetical protein
VRHRALRATMRNASIVRAFPLASLALLLLWTEPAAAAEPRACDEQMIRDEAHRARVWRYNWTRVNLALTVGAYVAGSLVDVEERPDWIVSGAGSAINVVTTWFLPLRVESAEEELDALPLGERGRHVRRLVLESAEDEHDRVRWPWHLANFGLSALGGGIIAFGYGHYESGLVTTLVGTALGSIQIFTQPTGLPGTCPAAQLTLAPRLTLLRAPDLSLSGAALSLTGTF